MDIEGYADGYDLEEGRMHNGDQLYKGSSDDTSASRALGDDDSEDDDDDDGNVMTPRGVYVQRCLYAPPYHGASCASVCTSSATACC